MYVLAYIYITLIYAQTSTKSLIKICNALLHMSCPRGYNFNLEIMVKIFLSKKWKKHIPELAQDSTVEGQLTAYRVEWIVCFTSP